MKYWVLYSDGHCDNGDHGWESFDSAEKATAFITQRLAVSDKPSIKNYVVIKGDRQELRVAEVATRVEILWPHRIEDGKLISPTED